MLPLPPEKPRLDEALKGYVGIRNLNERVPRKSSLEVAACHKNTGSDEPI
jgi:hypothetical protein